jgi:hypothetical protein
VLSAGQPGRSGGFQLRQREARFDLPQARGLEIVYVADPNNIPGAWFSDLADIVAGECASKFGIVGRS